MGFPNVELFFNLGLLGEQSGLGFEALVLSAFSRFTANYFQWFFSLGRFGLRGPRQGLNRVARKGGGEWPGRCGGPVAQIGCSSMGVNEERRLSCW